jgi:hypothetical protein
MGKPRKGSLGRINGRGHMGHDSRDRTNKTDRIAQVDLTGHPGQEREDRTAST